MSAVAVRGAVGGESSQIGECVCTVRAGDLAPDDPDLGSADLLVGAVDVGNLLAKVEAAHNMSVRVPPADAAYPASRHVLVAAYLAALVSSTPSILIRLVPGCVVWRPRW